MNKIKISPKLGIEDLKTQKSQIQSSLEGTKNLIENYSKQIANITGLGTALENKGILQKTAIALHRIALKKTDGLTR